MDPIRLGDMLLVPASFVGTSVVVALEQAHDEALPEGQEHVADPIQNAGPDDAFSGTNARPMLPIPVWESLQQCAVKLNAYEAIIANGGQQ